MFFSGGGKIESEEGRVGYRRRRRAAVQPLCLGEDAAVARGTAGTEDAVQRVRGSVQVGSARTRIPTRGEPYVRADSAFELAPQGHGAPSPEGAAPPPTTTTITTRAMPPSHSQPPRFQSLLTCPLSVLPSFIINDD